jgi:hypothetical protein
MLLMKQIQELQVNPTRTAWFKDLPPGISDKLILLYVWQRMGGDEDVLRGGFSDDVARWRGITLRPNDDRVVRIDWSSCDLGGDTIPPEIAELAALEELLLTGNAIKDDAEVPSEITELKGLRKLAISASKVFVQNETAAAIPLELPPMDTYPPSAVQRENTQSSQSSDTSVATTASWSATPEETLLPEISFTVAPRKKSSFLQSLKSAPSSLARRLSGGGSKSSSKHKYDVTPDQQPSEYMMTLKNAHKVKQKTDEDLVTSKVNRVDPSYMISLGDAPSLPQNTAVPHIPPRHVVRGLSPLGNAAIHLDPNGEPLAVADDGQFVVGEEYEIHAYRMKGGDGDGGGRDAGGGEGTTITKEDDEAAVDYDNYEYKSDYTYKSIYE